MSENRTHVGKEKILEKAEKLFTEHGFQAVSIRSIADICGVTNAALYYHFEDKAALFAEVMKRHTQRLSEHLAEAGEAFESPKDKIYAMAKEYLRLVSNRQNFMFLIRHHGREIRESNPRSGFVEMVTDVLSPFDDVLDQAVESGDVRPFPESYSGASILIGMIHGLSGYQRIQGDEALKEEDLENVIDYFWNGIKT